MSDEKSIEERLRMPGEQDLQALVEKQGKKIEELERRLGQSQNSQSKKATEILDLLENAETAWFKGKKIRLLKKVLKLDPKNRDALLALGDLHESKKEFDKAQEYYTKAFGKTEELTSFLFEKANSSKSDELAIQYYTTIISTDSQNASAINNLGSVFHSRGDLETAMNYYQRAIALNQSYYLFHQNLGAVCMGKNLFGTAARKLKKASELSPGEFGRYDSLTLLEKLAPHIGEAELPLTELINISKYYLEKQRIKIGSDDLTWVKTSHTDDSANKVIRFKGECPARKKYTGYKPYIYDIQISLNGDIISSSLEEVPF